MQKSSLSMACVHGRSSLLRAGACSMRNWVALCVCSRCCWSRPARRLATLTLNRMAAKGTARKLAGILVAAHWLTLCKIPSTMLMHSLFSLGNCASSPDTSTPLARSGNEPCAWWQVRRYQAIDRLLAVKTNNRARPEGGVGCNL